MTQDDRPLGIFTVDVTIADHVHPTRTRLVREVTVDTGSDATWISTSILEELGIRRVKRDIIEYANGLQAIRTIPYAIVRANGRETTDEVVFAEAGDHLPLGARALEGLGLMVDPGRKRLVDCGAKLAFASRGYGRRSHFQYPRYVAPPADFANPSRCAIAATSSLGAEASAADRNAS
jgi:predicted aspartyl protease